jgi:hypothetical protein
MDRALAEELLAMAREDLRVRERLARDGTLYDGYHRRMRAVHERNADRLAEVISVYGWPGPALVGAEASRAAWLVAQHAISRPALMRAVLPLLTKTSGIPRSEAAMMEDRIRVFEGRKQRFGTAFDWDDDGEMSPLPLEEPDKVDRYRAEVGLPPLAQVVSDHRRQAEREPKPADPAARKAEAEAFVREVGWR